MSEHLTLFDHLVVPGFLLFTVVEWLWSWPRTVRAIDAGAAGARLRAYTGVLVMEWAFVAYIAGVWLAHGRPWASLRMTVGTGWGLAFGIAIAAGYAVLAWSQRRALIARPDSLAKVIESVGEGRYILPHTSKEKGVFDAVAITAGICEELICRGFMIWYFGHWTGPVLAVAFSSVIFGFGHIYLGLRHVLKTALVGVAFALVVLGAGALWPAIVIHAIQDLLAGDLGYRALSAQGSNSAAT